MSTAGGRKERGELQQLVTKKDPIGGASKPTFETVGIVYAEAEALSGRTWLAAAQHNAEVTYRLRINARPGVSAGWRFVTAALVFEVKAALPGAKRGELHLMCTCKPKG